MHGCGSASALGGEDLPTVLFPLMWFLLTWSPVWLPLMWLPLTWFPLTWQDCGLRSECVLLSAGLSASPLKILCTPDGIRLQCFMKYFTEEMRVNWYHK